jgi:sialate O-acetylesterase
LARIQAAPQGGVLRSKLITLRSLLLKKFLNTRNLLATTEGRNVHYNEHYSKLQASSRVAAANSFESTKDQNMSDLWILAGQSNMEGCGKLKDVEESAENVRCFAHGDYWETAAEPLHWLSEAVDEVHHEGVPAALRVDRTLREGGAGLALTFAKHVSQRANIDIDLLPAAHGGTSMQQWSPDLKHLGGGSLYGALMRRVDLARQTNKDTRLRGLLWYQGESDANVQDAAAYSARMARLIEEFRTDLNFPDMPFYLVQIGCFVGDVLGGLNDAAGWEMIREQQRLLPTLVPHTATISAIDLGLDDGIHISTQSLKRLGRRIGNVALNKAYGREAPTGPQLRSVKQDGAPIRVSFDNVTRMLIAPDPAGRVPGFSLSFGNNRPTVNAFYKSYVDPQSPSDVLLYCDQPITPDVKLYYGADVYPFCQLTDAEDMGVPAFGPIAIG